MPNGRVFVKLFKCLSTSLFFLITGITVVLKIRNKSLQPVLPIKSSLENIMVEFICHEQVNQMFDGFPEFLLTMLLQSF
jgi:hypothetical protein